MAGMPGSGGVAHRTPFDLPTKRALAETLLAPVLAAALLALWLIVDPRTPDLAAQTYRVHLFDQLGFAVWDDYWYAGHDLPGYSLLFPPLASAIGLKLSAFLSVLSSAALFQRLAASAYGASARWGAALFAPGAVADVWIGRLTFALGVSLALAAALAFVRGRVIFAGLLAALCAAASPVAGVLLALAGATHAIVSRRRSSALSLAAPPLAVAGALAALFPEGGSEPYPFLSFIATVLVVLAFLLALPPGQALLRWGARIYLLACVLSVALSTPMGANVERYGVLLAGPLLLLAWAGREGSGEAPTGWRSRLEAWRPGVALALALVLWAAWVGWGPVRETRAVSGDKATSASYYEPVARFLAAHGPARVEVPLTRSHWEAALLAASVPLARGWEKQLDERYDRVLLEGGLTADSYRRWLREQAVSYVALPDAPLDPSSADEGRLLRRGLSYLNEVFASAHWRVYAVLDPVPIATGPGTLTHLAHDTFAVGALRPGRFLVRVHFSRYLTVRSGGGCVSRAPGGWTSLDARTPGTIVVSARFSLGRALGLETGCA
jgi:hypothetical protein